MKKLKKWLVRCVPALVLAFILVIPLAVPVGAEPIDYEDYITNAVQLDGTDIVTVTFPVDMSAWFTKEYVNGAWTNWYNFIRNSSWYWAYSQQYLDHGEYSGLVNVKCFPFGHYTGDNGTFPADADELSLDNIPDGAKLTFTFRFEHADVYNTMVTGGLSYYEEGNNSPVKTDSYEWPDTEDTISSITQSYTFTIDKSGGNYSGVRPYFEFSYNDAYEEFGIFFEGFTMELSISSLYQQYQQTGKTNKLLEAIEDKLEEQGTTMEEFVDQQQQTNDKLDEIIDSTVAPEAPDGDDTVNDYGDLEEGIMNDMSSNFSDADGYLTSATEIISKYGTALLAVSHLFGIFWKFPFFAELVMVAFAFGMFGALLGVSIDAISAHVYKPKYWNGKTVKSNSKYKGKFEKGGHK